MINHYSLTPLSLINVPHVNWTHPEDDHYLREGAQNHKLHGHWAALSPHSWDQSVGGPDREDCNLLYPTRCLIAGVVDIALELQVAALQISSYSYGNRWPYG